MSRAAHSPGPWQVANPGEYPTGIIAPHRYGAGDPEVICLIGGDIMAPESDEECQANARLIARAPSLLALLEEARAALPDAWMAERSGVPRELIERIDREIARATGGAR